MGQHVTRLTPVGMTLVEGRRADLGLGPDADWASRVTDEWLRWEHDGPGTRQERVLTSEGLRRLSRTREMSLGRVAGG